MPEMVRNAVKLTIIRKNACKTSSWSNLKWICITGNSCVLWPTFGQIESRGRWVRKTGSRHISTSGLASRAPGTLFLPYSGLYCRGIAHRRLEMLSIRKRGSPNLNLWPEKPEVLSKVPEMARKVVKLSVIWKTLWSNLKWICKTGSSCVLWPTFDVNTVKLGNGMR